MADKKPAKSTKKRQVKNPETFRQRAVKASSKQTSKRSFVKPVFGFIAIPFKKLKFYSIKLINTKFLRWLKKPIRLLATILLIPYFKTSFDELKLVTWPGWKQSRRLTYAVVIFAVVFGAVIAGLDWGLDKVVKNVLLK